MKLALYNDFRPGVLGAGGETMCDLSEVIGDAILALPPRDRMAAVIERYDELEERVKDTAAQAGVALDSIRLRAPLPRPTKVLCAQGNYMEGVGGSTRPIQLFLKAPTSVIGPGDTIELPPWDASVFHHEAELALVIGARAKNLASRQGLTHVFGYTCFMDVSARGALQRVGFGDKSLDTFGPMGPWIVTADEIADPHTLRIRLWVDGELRHDYGTDDMEHPIGELVVWASQISAMEPGDVISSGVNHQGIGPVQDGEVVEMEIEGIGRLSVNVSDPLGRTWPKGVDQELADFIRSRRLDPSLPIIDKLLTKHGH